MARRGERATLPFGGAGLDGIEFRAQHLLLQALQPGRGVKAELVAEPLAVVGIGSERAAGPAGLGKCGHQELHGPLPPGFLRHDGLQRGRGLSQAAQADQQGRPVLLGGQPQLVQAKRLSPCERLGELGVCRAVPQRERLVQQRQRGRWLLRLAGQSEQRGEALHVDRLSRHVKDVAGCPGNHGGRSCTERLAQPGGVGLQGVAGLIGRLLAEDVVHEPIERDDGAAPEHERGEQRPLPRPGHLDGLARHPDLKRPQDTELHLVLHLVTPAPLHSGATGGAKGHGRDRRHSVKRVIGRKPFRSAPSRLMSLNRLADGNPSRSASLARSSVCQ